MTIPQSLRHPLAVLRPYRHAAPGRHRATVVYGPPPRALLIAIIVFWAFDLAAVAWLLVGLILGWGRLF